MNKIWWIEHDKGGLGSYKTKKDAENAIKEGIETGFLNEKLNWRPVPHDVAICPTCRRPAEKDIVEGLGECLSCDHVRGDVYN